MSDPFGFEKALNLEVLETLTEAELEELDKIQAELEELDKILRKVK